MGCLKQDSSLTEVPQGLHPLGPGWSRRWGKEAPPLHPNKGCVEAVPQWLCSARGRRLGNGPDGGARTRMRQYPTQLSCPRRHWAALLGRVAAHER